MEIADHIKKEALEILENNEPLPHEISSAPNFYIARHDDSSILAFDAVEFGGSTYKLGVRRTD